MRRTACAACCASECPLTKGWSPAADWHQRNVDGPNLLKRKVRTRVPRIPAPAGAGNKIAECGSAVGAPRVSPAVVVGRQYMDR